MITWYLLITLASSTTPSRSVYANEQQACQAYLTAKASGPAFVYQISGKKDSPSISDGDCKPVQQFITQK